MIKFLEKLKKILIFGHIAHFWAQMDFLEKLGPAIF